MSSKFATFASGDQVESVEGAGYAGLMALRSPGNWCRAGSTLFAVIIQDPPLPAPACPIVPLDSPYVAAGIPGSPLLGASWKTLKLDSPRLVSVDTGLQEISSNKFVGGAAADLASAVQCCEPYTGSTAGTWVCRAGGGLLPLLPALLYPAAGPKERGAVVAC